MLRWMFSVLFVLVMSPSYAAEFRLTSPSIPEQGKISNEQVFSGMGAAGRIFLQSSTGTTLPRRPRASP